MQLLPDWRDILYPFWQRAPLWLRRRLVWAGSAKFIVGVVATCLNPRGQVLLLRHRFHNEYPWGLPGGWVERGETPLRSLLREVREETGLEATVVDVLLVDSDGIWMEVHYLCRVPDVEPMIQRSEVTDFRWIDPTSHSVPMKPSHMQAVAVTAARLAGRPSPLYPITADDRQVLKPSAKV